MPVQAALDIDLDGIEMEETRPAEESATLLPGSPAKVKYLVRRKSAFSSLKSKLTAKGSRSKGRLEKVGFDEYTCDLIASLKHHMKAYHMDIVADSIECQTRAEIAQYFRMTPEELELLNGAPSRQLLMAMDKKRRMTPRSGNRPNINESDEIDLKFDGEPVVAFYYNLAKHDVETIARKAAEPGTPREEINVGDIVYSLEMLKAAIIARCTTYRKHLKPEDFRTIFGKAPMPDLEEQLSDGAAFNMPTTPAHLI